jgi:hypothetical protein
MTGYELGVIAAFIILGICLICVGSTNLFKH